MRKHRQGATFPKISCPGTPHRCQEFRNFGEIRSMPMFSHFRLQEFWGNSSLAALSQPQMRKASAGIVNVTTTPLFFYLENCGLSYFLLAFLLLLLVTSSADSGGGIHFVPITCCSCCSCSCISTSIGTLVFSRSSCCVDVAEFYS